MLVLICQPLLPSARWDHWRLHLFHHQTFLIRWAARHRWGLKTWPFTGQRNILARPTANLLLWGRLRSIAIYVVSKVMSRHRWAGVFLDWINVQGGWPSTPRDENNDYVYMTRKSFFFFFFKYKHLDPLSFYDGSDGFGASSFAINLQFFMLGY